MQPDHKQLSLLTEGAASIAFQRGLSANSAYEVLCSLHGVRPASANIEIRAAIQDAFACC